MSSRILIKPLLLFLLPLLWAGFLLADEGELPQSAQAVEKPKLQVRSIHFEGNKSIPSGELKKILSTKETKFRWFFKAPLDEKVFEEDLDRIEKYYVSQGFYHMKLVSHKIEPLVKNNIRIVIHVDEGPPMIVSKLDLTIDGPSPEQWRRDILRRLPLKTGERFVAPAYKDIEKASLKYLADLGYPKAKTDMRARLDKGSNLATVTVSISVGPICTFGAIRLEGNQTVESKVIMREVAFHEGGRFDGSKIDTTQQRLYNLQLFQFVDISVDELEGESTVLPVRILVKESKKQTIRLGAGYGTEDQVRGLAQYEIRDFLGDGRLLQINAKASSLVQLLEGRFSQPYFFSRQGTLIVNGGIMREDQTSYQNNKVYVRPVYEHKWGEGLVTFAGYNLESNQLVTVDLNLAQRLANDRDHQDYYISSFIFGNTWEKVDSTLNPKKGWRLIQNMEWASRYLGSQVDYVKLTLEGRGYIPTFSYGTLATKLKWGGIEPLESTPVVPIFKRFFSGGSDSVRGYPYQRLGPLDSDGNAIGGMDLLEGSVEWRFPVRGSFEGVTFFDFGNVTPQIKTFSWDDTRYTAGVGVRYLTLVGPLRFDVGYELNPPKQNFFSPYQFHFSIGQAF